MASAAESLVRVLKSRPDQPPPPIEGDFEQAIARKMQARGIAIVPGLHRDERPDWITESRAAAQRMIEAQRATEAQCQAEEDAANASRSVASLLAGALAAQANSSGGAMPLNGAAVLRAALGAVQSTSPQSDPSSMGSRAGSPGTINGDQP